MSPRRKRRATVAKDARWCKAFSRHDLDGHVYVEKHKQTGRKVWVGRMTCLLCGTERVDFMVPVTCELMSRRYFAPEDYPTDLDRETARQQVLTELLIPEESPTS